MVRFIGTKFIINFSLRNCCIFNNIFFFVLLCFLNYFSFFCCLYFFITINCRICRSIFLNILTDRFFCNFLSGRAISTVVSCYCSSITFSSSSFSTSLMCRPIPGLGTRLKLLIIIYFYSVPITLVS